MIRQRRRQRGARETYRGVGDGEIRAAGRGRYQDMSELERGTVPHPPYPITVIDIAKRGIVDTFELRGTVFRSWTGNVRDVQPTGDFGSVHGVGCFKVPVTLLVPGGGRGDVGGDGGPWV
eukprot:763959-Hanusia_phi.AAC.14